MTVFDRLSVYGKDHPYKLWLEIISQLHKTLYNRIVTVLKSDGHNIGQYPIGPTKYQMSDNVLETILNLFKNLTEALPELTFRINKVRNQLYVEFEGELVGAIRLDLHNEYIFIAGHHYISKTSRTNTPIMMNTLIGFRKFIEQVIDPDDRELKDNIEKVIFQIT